MGEEDLCACKAVAIRFQIRVWAYRPPLIIFTTKIYSISFVIFNERRYKDPYVYFIQFLQY